MSALQKIKLDLSEKQLKKLMKGGTVQLTRDALRGDRNWLALEPKNMKKMSKALRLQKGGRLSLSEAEIDGSGIKEWWQKMKPAVKKSWDVYQKDIKPIVGPHIRKGLKKAAKTGLTALEISQPELIPLAEFGKKHSDKIVDWIGDKTTAYGFRAAGVPKSGLQLEATYSQLIAPGHPSFSPAEVNDLDHSYSEIIHHYHPKGSKKGKGFRAAGC